MKASASGCRRLAELGYRHTAVDVALAIDVAFGDVGGWLWGTPLGGVGEVKSDVVFATQVAP